MHTVKLGREGWLEQGFKKGMAEGRTEGVNEGRSEVALRMIEEGMSLEIVCRMTGLGRSELTRLQRKQA